MITTFTSATANSVQDEAVALLQSLAEKHGLTIRKAGGGFEGNKATLKFEFMSTSEEAEKAAFVSNCRLFNCKPEDYGRVATINGKEVTFIGFELKRRKFPIIVKDKTGKRSLYTEEVLAKYFHTGTAITVAPAIRAS